MQDFYTSLFYDWIMKRIPTEDELSKTLDDIDKIIEKVGILMETRQRVIDLIIERESI